MAATKVWKVTEPLPKLVSYITNPDKTAGGILVTGINCLPETAVMEMEAVKAQYGKPGGITAYHAYQSFAEGEVSAETAHEIGVKLAERLLGSRFQVLVSTHTDHENHIHNHFMWNSVSHTDGYRYNHDKTAYRAFRNESDLLCRVYQLSVIEKSGKEKTKSYADWKDARDGKPTAKELIRLDINYAVNRSRSQRDFVAHLKQMGYELKWGKELSVKAPGRERFLRPVRNFGEQYATANILRQLVSNSRQGARGEPRPILSLETLREINQKVREYPHQGLIRQHYHYALLITAYSAIPAKLLALDLRVEVATIEAILRQLELLAENLLDTLAKLLEYKLKQQQKIPPIIKERNRLYKAIRKTNDPEKLAEAKQRLKDIGYELKELRLKVSDGETIAEREPSLNRRITELIPSPKVRSTENRCER